MDKNAMGVNNNPLYYVIGPDQPEGWVPLNAFEQQIYQLPHTPGMCKTGTKNGMGKYSQGIHEHPFMGMYQ